MRLDTTLEQVQDIVNSCLKDTGCAYGGWPQKVELLCPMYTQGRDFAASLGGIVYVIRALINGDINYSPQLAEYAYTCSQCGACDISCYVLSIHRTDTKPSDFVRLLRSQLVHHGLMPGGPLKGYFDAVKPLIAGKAALLGDETADTVLYGEGSTSGSRANITDSTLNLMQRIGRRAVLLSGTCCGASLYDLGFWKELPEATATSWQALEPCQNKTLVFNDPHHMEFISRRYPELVPQYTPLKTSHVSQILSEAIISGRLKSTRRDRLRVSYHDPCRLGRALGIYDAPREVLAGLPGVELVEMRRNRTTAFCCGAWAFGNYYPDITTKTAQIRLEEFRETGADLLVTACPDCKAQLSKFMPLGHQDRIVDLVELVDERTR